jgi:hypothetical protein
MTAVPRPNRALGRDVRQQQQRIRLRIIIAEVVLDDPSGIVVQPMDQFGVGQRLVIELGVRQTRLPNGSNLICEPRLRGIFQSSLLTNLLNSIFLNYCVSIVAG